VSIQSLGEEVEREAYSRQYPSRPSGSVILNRIPTSLRIVSNTDQASSLVSGTRPKGAKTSLLGEQPEKRLLPGKTVRFRIRQLDRPLSCRSRCTCPEGVNVTQTLSSQSLSARRSLILASRDSRASVRTSWCSDSMTRKRSRVRS
jgi:hypothetical protein